MSKNNLIRNILAILFICLYATPATANNATPVVDLSHAREVIHYYEEPTNTNLAHVAFTEAAQKLRNYFNSLVDTDNAWGQKSTYEATSELLKDKPVGSVMLNQTKALLTFIADNENKQHKCAATTLEHLPQGTSINEPLFVVWGDGVNSSIAIAGSALLDITNQAFKHRQYAIWNQCIIALHKAQMQLIQPIPFYLSHINNSDEMLAYFEYKTLIDGSSFYAAYSNEPQLSFTIQPQARMDELYKMLAGPPRQLTDNDWQLINQLINDNTPRDLGNIMARKIDNQLGREALTRIYSGGSASFFRAYRGLR